VLRWHHDHGSIEEELRLARIQIAEIPAAVMFLHTVGHQQMLRTAIKPEGTDETGCGIEYPQQEHPEPEFV